MEAGAVTVDSGASDGWRSKPDPRREQEQGYALDQRISELVIEKEKQERLGLAFRMGLAIEGSLAIP